MLDKFQELEGGEGVCSHDRCRPLQGSDLCSWKNKEKYKIICLNLLTTVLKIVRCEASTERTEHVVQIPWFEPESNTED